MSASQAALDKVFAQFAEASQRLSTMEQERDNALALIVFLRSALADAETGIQTLRSLHRSQKGEDDGLCRKDNLH